MIACHQLHGLTGLPQHDEQQPAEIAHVADPSTYANEFAGIR
jgi:hypothetical protein